MKDLLLSLFLPAYLKVSLFMMDTPKHIASCLNNGYTRVLSQLFVHNIELHLLGETNIGMTNVIAALQGFFQSQVVYYFTAIQSNVRKKDGYLVGILNTQKNKYHVYVLMQQHNNRLLIHKIRIEHSNGSLN